MISQANSHSIEDIILKSLQQGDKNRGQLFDVTGKNYPILIQALHCLQNKGLIEIYFVPGKTVSVLTYRLRPES